MGFIRRGLRCKNCACGSVVDKRSQSSSSVIGLFNLEVITIGKDHDHGKDTEIVKR